MTNGSIGQPERVQLSRKRGWRMPENTVKVDRSTVWGNPFVAGQPSGVFPVGMGMRGQAETLIPCLTLEQSIALFEQAAQGFVGPEMYPAGHEWVERMHRSRKQHPSEAIRTWLRGKHLACWCKPGQPCHADVLLKIANER